MTSQSPQELTQLRTINFHKFLYYLYHCSGFSHWFATLQFALLEINKDGGLMRVLILVAIATTTILSSAHSCQTRDDCQLLGDCIDSQCTCDKGWKGLQCNEADLMPYTAGTDQDQQTNTDTLFVCSDRQWLCEHHSG